MERIRRGFVEETFDNSLPTLKSGNLSPFRVDGNFPG